MATKGTQFGRTMTYFRTVDIAEAKAALAAADDIVGDRIERDAQVPLKPEATRTRTRRAAAPPIPAEQLGTAAL